MTNGLHNTAYDSAGTIVRVVWGLKRIPVMNWTPPKVDTKTDRPPIVGEGIASRETPGKTEISEGNCEFLLGDWKDSILPIFGTHGSNLLRVNITVSISHPSMRGKYGQLFEGCRIKGREGPELKGDEKALVKKCTVSAMNVWECNEDRVWKCAAFLERLPSSEARALMDGWTF